MARYVLMPPGESPPQADVDLIEGASGVTVVDRGPRAMLIDAPADTVRELRSRLPAWTVADEVSYPPPGPPGERAREDTR